MTTAMITTDYRLSSAARARLEAELEGLLSERALTACEDIDTTGDAADIAEFAARDLHLARIDEHVARIRELLIADDLAGPRDTAATSGTRAVLPGTSVMLRFGQAKTPERFVFGNVVERGTDLEVVTPTSPVGRALLGAEVGQTVSYAAPGGAQAQVTVVEVEQPV